MAGMALSFVDLVVAAVFMVLFLSGILFGVLPIQGKICGGWYGSVEEK
jgi:hypothetical protein